MPYDENECIHGMPRDWCAACKYGKSIYDDIKSQYTDENTEKFFDNLLKMQEKE